MPPKVHFYSSVQSRESFREFSMYSDVQTWREVRAEVRLYDFFDPGQVQCVMETPHEFCVHGGLKSDLGRTQPGLKTPPVNTALE